MDPVATLSAPMALKVGDGALALAREASSVDRRRLR